MKKQPPANLQPEEFCPIRQTIRLLGKHWTILIIKELYYTPKKKLGFMDLRRRLPDASSKVLSQRLKEMVKNDLLKRKVHSKKMPIRVSYRLTDKGEDACKIIEDLKEYGIKWGGRETFDCSEINCELCRRLREQQ